MNTKLKITLLVILLFILFFIGFQPFILLGLMHIMDFGEPTVFLWFVAFVPVLYAYFSLFKRMIEINIGEREIIHDSYAVRKKGEKGFLRSRLGVVFKDSGKLLLVQIGTIFFYAFTAKELSEPAMLSILDGIVLGFFYFITNLCFIVIIYIIREGRYGKYEYKNK